MHRDFSHQHPHTNTHHILTTAQNITQMTEQTSYRPHDPGHDYYAAGIYLVTLVVRNRSQRSGILGHLNDDARHPTVELSDIGKAVMDEWQLMAVRAEAAGRHITLHAAVCMPNHFHGVIEVIEHMDKSLGHLIWGFKTACTKRRREIMAGSPELKTALDATNSPPIPIPHPLPTPKPFLASADPHRMSKRQRQAYYDTLPDNLQPLWDDNYDDTICLSDPVTGVCSQRHFNAMMRYVADNPRRAIIRRQHPDVMQRRLHLVINGRPYAAFGNLFLLRWPRKVQVFCHRKAHDHHTPYEQTEDYRQRCMEWKEQVMEGATVIVTPGISAGERMMKNLCLEKRYPLIHLQKEPIGEYWKPEQSRFDACSDGSLLIIAPWMVESLGDVNGVPSQTDYSIFHNLNKLAEEICSFNGDAHITI